MVIYEQLQSTFLAVAGLFRSLEEALDRYYQLADAAGRPEAPDLLFVQGLAAGREAQALVDAADALTAWPGLGAALGTGATQINGHEAGLVAMRTRYDLASGTLGPSAENSRCTELFDSLTATLRTARQELEEASSPQGPAFNLGRIRGSVDDLAAYPVLTSDSGGGGGTLAAGGSPATGGTVAAGVQRTVDLAVRQVLGRLPKYTDAKAFSAALSATFELRPEDGHTVAVWQPRGFVGQTELGGSVSGAQASIYARAVDALSAALPVLRGLTPLRPDADVQEMDAARAVVESEFRAVVEEIGVPGGARAARVTALFDILLRQTVVGIGNVNVPDGMVGYLGNVFGLVPTQVNTIEEEQVYSNYLLLGDYIRTIEQSWTSFNSTFAGRDLGTRLVLLSNALQVVAESVDEVAAAMDSVFVGAAERTVARFTTGPGTSMLVSELLTWISSFATQEAPELVQQAGRRGMGPVESTGSQLIGLVGQLSTAITADPGLPAGMRHPRVRHPLEELRTYLEQVTQLASDVRSVPTP
jgi:hypothetical protein